jgi:hypothetical protein
MKTASSELPENEYAHNSHLMIGSHAMVAIAKQLGGSCLPILSLSSHQNVLAP